MIYEIVSKFFNVQKLTIWGRKLTFVENIADLKTAPSRKLSLLICSRFFENAGPKHFSTTNYFSRQKNDCACVYGTKSDSSTEDTRCQVQKTVVSTVSKKKKKEDPGFFASLFGKKKKLPSGDTCRAMEAQRVCQYMNDLPEFVEKLKGPETVVHRTEGRAYVLDFPNVSPITRKEATKEEILVGKLQTEANAKRLHNPCNPMPEFTTVGQRWIDLQSRKLHPFYKKYETIVSPATKKCIYPPENRYKTAEDDCLPDKLGKIIPKKQKVIFAEFKQTELPQQLLKRMKELELNVQSSMESRPLDKTGCKNVGPRHVTRCPESESKD